MPKIAVLIPCYNEEKTIGKVVDDFKLIFPDADIYVYNNNSTDNTVEIAKEHGAIVEYVYQQGKGFVIRNMFRDIEADCYITVDGDDQVEASDAAILAKHILNGRADIVIGDRLSGSYFSENNRRFHGAGNRLVRGLINHIFKSNVRDIMSGYRAFSRKFVKTFPILSGGFEIETEMTIHMLDKRILYMEEPIQYRDRIEGSVSKLNTVSDGIKVLKTIFMLYKDYRPFGFFNMISFLFFIVSFGMLVPVLVDYYHTGLVARFPTLFVSVGLGIIGILSFTCGIILDTIKKHNDRTYELLANFISK